MVKNNKKNKMKKLLKNSRNTVKKYVRFTFKRKYQTIYKIYVLYPLTTERSGT